MKFYRINSIAGWLVCAFSSTVFILTTEAGGSFWDCGEFVSSCFKIQIPHPPGAPLFILLGRISILLAGNNPMTAAKAVNIMSAIASGFTILFLFWTITGFARKMVQRDPSKALTGFQQWTIIAAGCVGALAGTFTDSFWYSAVEGEVYALSSFFTALVFWGALKWERVADEPGGDRWLVFIFFMIGISIGVHLLCLLCIPAIVLLWYFKRRNSINYKLVRKYFIRIVLIGGAAAFFAALIQAQSAARPEEGLPMDGTVAGLVLMAAIAAVGVLLLIERLVKEKKEYYGGIYIFLLLGVAILGVIMKGVIQYSIKAAGSFDIFFVNDLGFPFFSGFAFFFLLIGIALWRGLRLAGRKKWHQLRVALWCIIFTLVGYSSYLTTMIRSNANPSIDLFNVDNPQSLAGYLGRDQYGDFPLLYGQTFNAQPAAYSEEPTKFEKGKNRYIPTGKEVGYLFQKEDQMVFPRMWDMTNDQFHADYYASFLGIGKVKDTYERGPSFSENLRFFLQYQVYYMYIRYFFWNFSGKQNDVQGYATGDVRDGNWITGIPVVDNVLYGDQSLVPASLRNKSHNVMYMLPFILGLIGFVYQIKRKGSDALVNLILFLSTGIAIVIYINQPGYQPRERDYAYAGSFYAFAIWIGLSVIYLTEMAASWDKKLWKNMMIRIAALSGLLMLFILMAGYGGAAGITVGTVTFILAAAVSAGFPRLLSMLRNRKLIVILAIAGALSVPLLMGMQEWDDHDRSHKQLARDMAKDYLESCAPNAILFTLGDNDTYPLWYAQEVEGIRPDVRIVITTLLGSDWMIDELRRKVNESDPLDVIWTADQVQGHKRDYIFYQPVPQFRDSGYHDLYDIMKNWAGSDDPEKMVTHGDEQFHLFPTRKVMVPVDTTLVKRNGTVNENDKVVSQIRFDLPAGNVLYKNDLAILNIIAANKWKRPIYFTMPYTKLGFGNYLRRDGLAYRLVPVENASVNTERMYHLVMNAGKWGYGNANVPGVYFDEINRNELLGIRRADIELAFSLIEKKRLRDADAVLRHDDQMIRSVNLPYGMTSANNMHDRISLAFLQACYQVSDEVLAAKAASSLKRDLLQQQKYYQSLDEDRQGYFQNEMASTKEMLEFMGRH